MPSRIAERDILVGNIAVYLKAHRDMENPPLGITASNGEAIHARLIGLRSAVREHQTEEKTLSAKRMEAGKNLRKRMQSLIQELRLLLGPDDVRWTAFGFDSPAERRRKNADARAKAKAEAKVEEIKIAELPLAKAA